MLQAVLVSPTAKLDISRIVRSSPSPSPPSPSTTSLPPISRAFPAASNEPGPQGCTSPTGSVAPPQSGRVLPRGSFSSTGHGSTGSQASVPATTASGKRIASTSPLESRHANKKPTRQWSEVDSEELLRLRGANMKWDDIARRFPSRTATACRLRYQNYLERKHNWTEEKKQRLARLYDRHKQDMWLQIANELNIPWRAVEDMHWVLGQEEMASLAGARLLHPDRHSGDPASGGQPMQSVLPPIHGQATAPPGFVSTPSSTFPKLPPNAGAMLGQSPVPATTNGTMTPRFVSGGEETGFGFHRRGRRQRSSGGQLPSLAELTSGVPAYATHRERYGDDEEVNVDNEADEAVIKRER